MLFTHFPPLHITNVITLGLLQHFGPDGLDPVHLYKYIHDRPRGHVTYAQTRCRQLTGMDKQNVQDVDNQQVCKLCQFIQAIVLKGETQCRNDQSFFHEVVEPQKEKKQGGVYFFDKFSSITKGDTTVVSAADHRSLIIS